MLAAQAETQDDGVEDRVAPTRRKSMLKKTMKAIGKVKPKFKKSKNKNLQMELMNSCSSFDDFDLSDDNSGTDDEEDEEDFDETEQGMQVSGDEEEGEDHHHHHHYSQVMVLLQYPYFCR